MVFKLQSFEIETDRYYRIRMKNGRSDIYLIIDVVQIETNPAIRVRHMDGFFAHIMLYDIKTIEEIYM